VPLLDTISVRAPSRHHLCLCPFSPPSLFVPLLDTISIRAPSRHHLCSCPFSTSSPFPRRFYQHKNVAYVFWVLTENINALRFFRFA
jgi:hypothetical protein